MTADRSQPVFRFAPSPNGFLHLGHAYAALHGYDVCRRAGGRFLLRIEDIDPARSREAYVEAMVEDLAWLGLSWEEPVLRQSRNMDAYRVALDRLKRMGLVYPAFMSRAEAASTVGGRSGWPADPDGTPHYPPDDGRIPGDEAAARIARGDPYSLRLRMAAAVGRIGPLTWREDGRGPEGESGTIVAQPERWGDVVLARRDVATSYHVSVVVDDAAQGVTDVVRGQDLFHATSIHALLQALLGLPAPRYRHHRLIVDDTGSKLAKRRLSTPLRDLRGDGVSVDEIRRLIGL